MVYNQFMLSTTIAAIVNKESCITGGDLGQSRCRRQLTPRGLALPLAKQRA